MSAENPTPPPVFDQFSRALNVYHKTNNNLSAKFEIDEVRDELNIHYYNPVVVPGTLIVGPDRVDVFERFLDLQSNIEEEATFRISDKEKYEGDLALEVTRATAAEQKVADALSLETTNRGNADTALSSAIAAETTRAKGVEAAIRSEASTEKLLQDGKNADHDSTLANHTVFIEENALAISAEFTRADSEEKAIRALIETNAGSASGDASAVAADLAQEVLDRASELSSLETRFEEAAAAETIRVDGAIAEEKKRAEDAEAALSAALTTRIDNVLSNIDPAIIDSFSEVVTALNAAGGDITTGLNIERGQRVADVTAIQSRLDDIEAMLQALQAQ